jgi:hypothetical protein
VGEGGEDADFLQELGEDFEEDVGPETSTGGVEWHAAAAAAPAVPDAVLLLLAAADVAVPVAARWGLPLMCWGASRRELLLLLRRGDKALAVVQQLLAAGGDSGLADVELFSFRAIPSSKRLDIRLDKTTGAPAPPALPSLSAFRPPACCLATQSRLIIGAGAPLDLPRFLFVFYCPPADQYGSPTLDDIATFSRLFNAAYEVAVGEATAGAVEIEVSSAVSLSYWLGWLLCDFVI